MKTSFVLSLFLFGIGGHGPVAMAQSLGTFTATGNMTTSRVQHTATLLLDGKVLIAGGQGNTSMFYITSSAVLYNLKRRNIRSGYQHVRPTGNLTRARYAPSATLLPDGRVLIAGGFGPLESTESGGCPASS